MISQHHKNVALEGTSKMSPRMHRPKKEGVKSCSSLDDDDALMRNEILTTTTTHNGSCYCDRCGGGERIPKTELKQQKKPQKQRSITAIPLGRRKTQSRSKNDTVDPSGTQNHQNHKKITYAKGPWWMAIKKSLSITPIQKAKMPSSLKHSLTTSAKFSCHLGSYFRFVRVVAPCCRLWMSTHVIFSR
jgi:hypothetical protein